MFSPVSVFFVLCGLVVGFGKKGDWKGSGGGVVAMAGSYGRRIVVVVVGVLALLSVVECGQCTEVTRFAELNNPDKTRRSFMGSYVSISENTMLASAFGDNRFSGAVYVYSYRNGKWVFSQKLKPSDNRPGDHFGWEAEVRGNNMVVGAVYKRTVGKSAGKAYVYKRRGPGTPWEEFQQLLPSDQEPGDHYGYSVTISSKFIFVGAEMGLKPAAYRNKAGAVYIYERAASGMWTLQQVLRGENAYDQFGDDVKFGGGNLVVGAPFAEGPGAVVDSGAFYIYRKDNSGVWTQRAKFTSPGRHGAGNQFGTACSITPRGTTVVCGSQSGYTRGVKGTGSAFVYRQSGGKWTLYQRLVADDLKVNDRFGYRSSIRGGLIVISAPGSSDVAKSAGASYVFMNVDGKYININKYRSQSGAEKDLFGLVSSITKSWLVISKTRDDSDQVAGSTTDTSYDDGSVVVYKLIRSTTRCIYFLPPPLTIPTKGNFKVSYRACTNVLPHVIELLVTEKGSQTGLFRTEKLVTTAAESGSISVDVKGLQRGKMYSARITLLDDKFNRLSRRSSPVLAV